MKVPLIIHFGVSNFRKPPNKVASRKMINCLRHSAGNPGGRAESRLTMKGRKRKTTADKAWDSAETQILQVGIPEHIGRHIVFGSIVFYSWHILLNRLNPAKKGCEITVSARCEICDGRRESRFRKWKIIFDASEVLPMSSR